MPDKKATYRINETMLRNTLLGYTVEVDAAECERIEQEASAIRMQKSFVMPDTNTLVKFVAVPLAIIGIAILVFANIDSIQSAFTPVPKPVVKSEKKVVVSRPVVKTPTVTVVNTTPPPVVKTVVAKRESVIVATKTTDTAKQQQATKKAIPVIAGPPTDSATSAAKTENTIKETKVDTVAQKPQEPSEKKKKKRRRRSDAYIEDVKESSLQPNSADDDVVVPQ